jgi:hypothetical protein
VRDAAGLWLVAVFLVGCGGGPAAIPTQPIESYQFRQAQGGVHVALDPFINPEQTGAAFHGGEEFLAQGLLPIQVLIENDSPAEVRVNPADFRLIRPNGESEISLSPHDAFDVVKVGWGFWAFLPVLGTGPSAYRNEVRQKDIEGLALEETTIPAGKSANGFVYFEVREGETNLAGHRVTLSIQGPEGRKLTYEIPIGGRTDIASPSERSTQPSAPTAPAPSSPTQSREPTVIHGTGGGVIIRSPSR